MMVVHPCAVVNSSQYDQHPLTSSIHKKNFMLGFLFKVLLLTLF